MITVTTERDSEALQSTRSDYTSIWELVCKLAHEPVLSSVTCRCESAVELKRLRSAFYRRFRLDRRFRCQSAHTTIRFTMRGST